MAGHSKFKNIMYRKGAQDKKRSAMFSKLSPRDHRRGQDRACPIPTPIRACAPRSLAARAQSMPKDNIQRAIDKAAGGDAENYEEIRYEGFGPGGVSLVVEALTDNRNRTATNVRTIFSKNGGNLGASGSVTPRLRPARPDRAIRPRPATPTTVLEAAIEAGAEDVESDEDGHEIWTAQDDLHDVARALEAALGEPESIKLAWRPQTSVEVAEDDAEQLLKLVDALEEDDDVQTVWGNYEVSEEVMERLA